MKERKGWRNREGGKDIWWEMNVLPNSPPVRHRRQGSLKIFQQRTSFFPPSSSFFSYSIPLPLTDYLRFFLLLLFLFPPFLLHSSFYSRLPSLSRLPSIPLALPDYLRFLFFLYPFLFQIIYAFSSSFYSSSSSILLTLFLLSSIPLPLPDYPRVLFSLLFLFQITYVLPSVSLSIAFFHTFLLPTPFHTVLSLLSSYPSTFSLTLTFTTLFLLHCHHFVISILTNESHFFRRLMA